MSGLLNLVMEKYLEEGIQHDYIPSQVANFLASGVPGSRKTSLHYSLFDLPPPPLRISTACIEQAKRAVLVTRSSEDSSSEIVEFKPVEETDLKQMIAKEMTEERISAEVFSEMEKTLKENPPVDDRSTRPLLPDFQMKDHQPQHSPQLASSPQSSPTPSPELIIHL